MGKLPLTDPPSQTSRAVRSGRPPRVLAGEVDARILNAARRVFLERGLAGASIDEIAGLARAGKPTIYARFTSKEALLTAVVMDNVAANIAGVQSHVPTGGTIDERLADLGVTSLQWVLGGDTINMMRLVIAEARQFPDLANSVHGMAEKRAADATARLLGEAAQSEEGGMLPAFAPEQLATTTQFFFDLVVFPLIRRALFGEKPEPLRDEIAPHVARSVAFFLAACRHGAVA
jgi:AcrR family transcriptional regulator